jgi:hypothetical protein
MAICLGDGFMYVGHGGVVVLATITVVEAVVVSIPVVVAVVTVAGAAAVVLAKWVRRRQ